MSDTLHSYHPLSFDETRGVHCFTTQSPDEAQALSTAIELRRALRSLAGWADLITASLAESHGDGGATKAVQSAFAKADAVLTRSGQGD